MPIESLLALMAKLRDKDHGCPWDLEQTLKSIIPHTLEEVYEVVDAIERDDMAHLKEELGDLLFQIVFYTQMSKELGHFTFDDVVADISNKLIRRHPHIFADATITTLEEQSASWERIKEQERQAKNFGESLTSVLDHIPHALPALLRSSKIQKTVAKLGFNWEKPEDLFDKIEEEIAEIKEAIHTEQASKEAIEEEIGDLLFCLCNLANFYDINPEEACRKSNHKFAKRFFTLEQHAKNNNLELKDLSFDEMNRLWELAKKA